MVTKAWKVYGYNGHRQRESFFDSYHFDFSDDERIRIIDVANFDKTGTHDYTIVTITCNTIADCIAEFEGQLSDGIFENSRYGFIEEVQL